MRGASAEALKVLTEGLPSVLAAGDAAQIGTELFGVAGLLRTEPALRRVATDLSVATEAKTALVHGVLDSRVSPAVADLVADAVGRRWTATRDLADSLEQLGVVSVVRSASDPARLSDELFSVGQAIKEHPELRDALADPSRTAADKRSLMEGLLSDKVLAATLALIDQALSGSYRTVTAALEAYGKVAAHVRDQQVATVVVSTPLSEADSERLAVALSRQYGRQMHLNVVVDPRVVGGIKVEVGDDVIDGTVSTRLDDARRRLAG
ncbi:F0F1 ATP synthase subunit delta [Nocardioides limicola]|uniref:F0F1 ATP synthase subunit delta n=1 Tax=Nocardioides limicola TaxID=2803368 RepID=UPI00193BCB6C|nr:F0F1 ATP synthase subunit delta [Nocardioides sp. DJM-14]